MLAAGLTAIGIPAHEAIPAVLLFRMATFWLPIPVGWVSYVMLQRRGVLSREARSGRACRIAGAILVSGARTRWLTNASMITRPRDSMTSAVAFRQ